ncbi:hypothetical protein Taro_005055 [Colocasia esculenta]|uniref:Uncharacterized protein n=1 Tax=Colocasia esculenta TaxID=4460 RepID=A0A843TJW0_COLES|nr:hypothetical protein [Colocasia esculenta]
MPLLSAKLRMLSQPLSLEAYQKRHWFLILYFYEDESLRKWKEQLLGSVDLESVGEHLEADVKILSFSILSPGRPDVVLPLPIYAP